MKIESGDWDVPGTWTGVQTASGGRSAILTCPDCGQPGSLSGHSIADDGAVNPSVVCTHDDCGFHEWVRLAGWSTQRKEADVE